MLIFRNFLALYAVIFEDGLLEGAYSNLVLWETLGLALPFVFKEILAVRHSLTFMLSLLAASMGTFMSLEIILSLRMKELEDEELIGF